MSELLPHELQQLWEGAIALSIIHAVATSKFPDLSNEHSWDGSTYCVQDSMGSRGAIHFVVGDDGVPTACVGALFSLRSDRQERCPTKEPLKYFIEVPKTQLSFVGECFEYLLDECGGQNIPLVTCGFWAQQNKLFSQDNWPVFLSHGGYLVEDQLHGAQHVLEKYCQEKSLTEDESFMVRQLFNQRVSCPTEWVTLSRDQLKMLETNGVGIDECWEKFSELRIRFPTTE